jgi:hypothetical protein
MWHGTRCCRARGAGACRCPRIRFAKSATGCRKENAARRHLHLHLYRRLYLHLHLHLHLQLHLHLHLHLHLYRRLYLYVRPLRLL